MGRRRKNISDGVKLAVLDAIEERKDALFGSFGRSMDDARTKTDAWKEVLQVAIDVELCNANRNWVYVRDKCWSTWKSKTMDKARQTGGAGGSEVQLTDVDNKILDIVGRDSAAVVGLQLPQTDEPISEEEDNATESPAPKRMRTLPTSPMSAQLQKKLRLQIEGLKKHNEYLDLKAYKTKLECLALERQLDVARSEHTKDL